MRELALNELSSIAAGRDDALAVQLISTAAITASWSTFTNREDPRRLLTVIKQSWLPTAFADAVCRLAYPDPAISSPASGIAFNYDRLTCATASGVVQGLLYFVAFAGDGEPTHTH